MGNTGKSIKCNGLLQTLIAEMNTSQNKTDVTLKAGQRRWKPFKKRGTYAKEKWLTFKATINTGQEKFRTEIQAGQQEMKTGLEEMKVRTIGHSEGQPGKCKKL
jgi:hypothetical protein